MSGRDRNRAPWRAAYFNHSNEIPKPLRPWVYVLLAVLAGVLVALALCWICGGL